MTAAQTPAQHAQLTDRVQHQLVASVVEHLALPVVRMVHDLEVEDVAGWLARYDHGQLVQLCIVLGALADPDVPPSQALAWLTSPPSNVVPLHADEWPWDAPPLRVESAVAHA